MGNGNTWHAVKVAFVRADELKHLIKAEIGLTDRYLSFVALMPNGERRRAEIRVASESGDGTQHRETTGKLIRGLDETGAKKMIARINRALAGSGTVLKEVRREVVNGKKLVVYKRRDPRALAPRDDETPAPVVHDQNTEITVVNFRYADVDMTRRRSD